MKGVCCEKVWVPEIPHRGRPRTERLVEPRECTHWAFPLSPLRAGAGSAPLASPSPPLTHHTVLTHAHATKQGLAPLPLLCFVCLCFFHVVFYRLFFSLWLSSLLCWCTAFVAALCCVCTASLAPFLQETTTTLP